mmetsp:Transcript_20740/g.61897  ORF Transcript_20740/g.61897 Transcript_20740/m.61897 type:complete len:220 (-) Transcript_20740:188-847(-)
MGARTMMARSTSSASRNARAVAGPPSTMRWRTPYVASSVSRTPGSAAGPAPSRGSTTGDVRAREKTTVRSPSEKSVASGGARPSGSITTRSGCASASTRRTVSDGSSRATVDTPTSTASLMRRSRCTASSDSGDVKRPDLPARSSTAPRRSTAIFSVTWPDQAAVVTRKARRAAGRILRSVFVADEGEDRVHELLRQTMRVNRGLQRFLHFAAPNLNCS